VRFNLARTGECVRLSGEDSACHVHSLRSCTRRAAHAPPSIICCPPRGRLSPTPIRLPARHGPASGRAVCGPQTARPGGGAGTDAAEPRGVMAPHSGSHGPRRSLVERAALPTLALPRGPPRDLPRDALTVPAHRPPLFPAELPARRRAGSQSPRILSNGGISDSAAAPRRQAPLSARTPRSASSAAPSVPAPAASAWSEFARITAAPRGPQGSSARISGESRGSAALHRRASRHSTPRSLPDDGEDAAGGEGAGEGAVQNKNENAHEVAAQQLLDQAACPARARAPQLSAAPSCIHAECRPSKKLKEACPGGRWRGAGSRTATSQPNCSRTQAWRHCARRPRSAAQRRSKPSSGSCN